MSDERLSEVLNQISSNLEEGLKESRACVGLTHEDSERYRFLRDKVAYSLGIIDFYKETLKEVQK